MRVLDFRTPTPQTQKLFEQSFNVTLDRYRTFLADLGKGEVTLRNDNFDVGETTARGQYRLEDNACAQLLDELAKKEFSEASPELRADLLRFFSSSDIPSSDRLSEKARARLKGDVQALEKAALASPVAKN